MWFFGSLLVLGAGFVTLVFPFWAMSRAGEAKRRAEEAEKRMQAMERLLEKLRAEILSLREAGPTPAFEASAPSSHPAAESAAVFEAAFAAAGPVVEALPPAMTQQQARSLFDPPPPEPRVEPAPPRSTKVLRKGKQHREPASARESREHAHPHPPPPPPPPPPPESASPIIEAQGPIIEAHPIEARTHAPSAEPAPLPAAQRKTAKPPLPARGSDAEVRAAVARYSAWNESVRPFLVENVGWFIGGFLVIAGSLFWIRLAWNSFEAVGRHLLSVTVLLAYAAGFVGVGFWLKKKQALPTASRAMAYVGLSLLPVALLSAAALFPSSHLAWGLVLPITIAAAYPVLYLAAGLLDRPLARPLATGLCALLALVGLVPAAAAISPPLALALPYLGWAVVHAAAGAPLRGMLAPSTAAIAFHLAALSYGLAFVIGLAHVIAGSAPEAPPLPAAYGPLAVLISLTALRVDVELRARWKGNPEIDAAVVAAFAATLGGVAATANHPPLFALSAALAAALFALGLRWYRRPLLLVFSIAAGSAAYAALVFLVPPLSTLRESVGDALAGTGFMTARPGAWAFLLLPLAEGAARLAARYRAREETRLRRAAEQARWALVAAAAAFAVASGSLRATSVTLLAVAALACAWHLRRPRLRTAWTGAIALAAGVLLAASPPGEPLPLSLATAAALVLICALPGLRGAGHKPGASALLTTAALLSSAAAISAPSFAGLDWRFPVAVAGVSWALFAFAFASALPGLLAAAAVPPLVAATLFGRDAATWRSSSPLWLALPAALVALGLALRLVAHRLRARPAWHLFRTALPWRARGLHALSEPLLWAAWLATGGVALRSVSAPPVPGAVILLGACGLWLALDRIARASLGRWLGAAAFVAAGAQLGPALLGPLQGSAALGAAAAAVVALGLTWLVEREPLRRWLPRRTGSPRTLGTALLVAALVLAPIGLVVELGAQEVLQRDLAAVALVYALGALSLSSAHVGFVAALAASALAAATAFGAGNLVNPLAAADPRWLALLAGQIGLAVGLRLLARRLRGAKPRIAIGLPRARGLHALSEPLRWSAWTVLALLCIRGLLTRDLHGAAVLVGAAAAAFLLGAIGRRASKPGAGGISATAFAAACAVFAVSRFDLAIGPAALGVIVGATLLALAAPLAGKGRRLGAVAEGARATAVAAVSLATVGALLGSLPLLSALTGVRAGQINFAPQLALALALAVPALFAIGSAGAGPSGLAILAAAGACLVGPTALGREPTEVGTALAVSALAALWAERALRGRGGATLSISQALVWGAPFLAVLAFAASFFPPAETFAAPLRQAAGLHLGHIPTDLLLVGFLLSALAARGSPIFLHLLFIEAAVTATRVRLSLGVATRGHGMVLAGGALLVLAVLIRKKPRHSFATLLWCAAALAGGWARMLFFPPAGFSLDTQEWAWALAAALLALPLAKLLWTRAIALAAVGGLAGAVLAGGLQLSPAWFAQAWPLAMAAVALGLALLATLLDKLDDARVPFLAREETASSFGLVGGALAALGGGFAALAAGGSALRISAPLDLALGIPTALTLLFAAAAAFLILRARTGLMVPTLVVASALGLTCIAAPLLAPIVGPSAPVVVLAALALLARELSRIESVKRELSLGALILWIASLVATRGQPAEWTTGAAVAAGALVLRGVSIFDALAAISLPTWLLVGGAGFGLAWAGPRLPLVGDVGIPAGVALCALLAACLHELRAARRGSSRLDATLLAGTAFALLVVAGLSDPLLARASAIAAGVGLGVVLLSARAASGVPIALDLALAAVAALYLYGRARLNLFAGVADFDRNVVLGAAVALVPIERLLARSRRDLAAPLARGSALLPLALLPFAAGPTLPTCAAGAAMLYGVLAFVHRSKAAAIAGLVLANVFFFATWRERGVADAQLYTIPVGVSLLLAAQLSRRDLHRVQLQWLRSLGCLVLYAGTAFQMAASDSLLFPMLLGGMALATVALGIGLQIRSFVYLGTATLVVTVLSNLVRYSARSSRVLAVSATLTGLAIMGGMAYFSVRREQALQLYRRLVRGMDEWE